MLDDRCEVIVSIISLLMFKFSCYSILSEKTTFQIKQNRSQCTRWPSWGEKNVVKLHVFWRRQRGVGRCSNVQLNKGHTSIQASECSTAFPSPMPKDDVRETFLCLSMDDLPPLDKSQEAEEEPMMMASKSLPADFFQKRWPSCIFDSRSCLKLLS